MDYADNKSIISSNNTDETKFWCIILYVIGSHLLETSTISHNYHSDDFNSNDLNICDHEMTHNNKCFNGCSNNKGNKSAASRQNIDRCSDVIIKIFHGYWFLYKIAGIEEMVNDQDPPKESC